MVSPIVQTGLIYLAARGFAVLLFYLILIEPYLNTITNEALGGILRIIVFIIALAFVVGGGKGVMTVGKLFSFRIENNVDQYASQKLNDNYLITI